MPFLIVKPITQVRTAVIIPGINPAENVTAAVNTVSTNNGNFNKYTNKGKIT